MDYFNGLPLEITVDILTRLPTESVLECKLVCTSWRSLVTHNPSFSKMHLHHLNHPFTEDDPGKFGFLALTHGDKIHYIEYNENHESINPIQRIRMVNLTSPLKDPIFVGSCNGLICFVRYPYVLICNPITREYVMLPEIKRDLDCDINGLYYGETGFGYVSSTNQYKVVAIYASKTHVEVHIYTLGSGNGWRNIGKFNFRFSIHVWEAPGIFSNGALYWLDVVFKTIITFDLAEEKFCEHLSPPPMPTGTRWPDSRIGGLNGFLYYAASLVVERAVYYDIWLLKKKNDNHEMKEQEEHQSLVWSKEFTANSSRLFAVTKNYGVSTYRCYYLSIYDTKTSTLKRLAASKSYIRKVSAHKNTLVSLKELGEEDTKVMDSAKMEETKNWDYSFK